MSSLPQPSDNDTTMALSTLTTLLVLFAFVAAASCLPHLNFTSPDLPQIHFDSSLAATCTKPRSQQGPECNFDWHNTSIWIGGVVPGPKNDILIDAQNKTFTLLCNGLCTGGGLNSTTRTLTIRMSENGSMVLDTWTAINTVLIEGGAFDATEVTVTALQPSTYFMFERVTRSSVDSIRTRSFRANQTTIEIGSLTADGAYFYGSEVTVTDELVTGTIWYAFDSELYFLGTCNSSAFFGTFQVFQNTYMQTTTACQPLSQDTLFANSEWDIYMDSDSLSTYLLPDWITLDLSDDSAIHLMAAIELRINTTVRLSNSYVMRIDDEASAVLLDNGYLSGHQGNFFAPLTALGGVIEAFDDYFEVSGVLHVGPKATIYIKDSGYLLTELLVLDQPTLNYSSAGSVRNFIEFNEGKLNGSFGAVNMNYLPYVIEYDNTQGYIAVALSNSQAPPQVLTPSAQSVSASSPTDIFNEQNLIIVLAIALVAAAIGLIVLGALYRRAKRQGYQVINDAQHHA